MRILPPTLVLICVVIMGIARFLLPGPPLVSPPANGLGVILLGAGLALSMWGERLFHKMKTNIKTFNDPTVLVTDGPFRWSRNPMYLGFVAFLAGLGVILGTLVPLLVPVLFAIITDRWYIRFEETVMSRAFGETYAAYRAKTRRWL